MSTFTRPDKSGSDVQVRDPSESTKHGYHCGRFEPFNVGNATNEAIGNITLRQVFVFRSLPQNWFCPKLEDEPLIYGKFIRRK